LDEIDGKLIIISNGYELLKDRVCNNTN